MRFTSQEDHKLYSLTTTATGSSFTLLATVAAANITLGKFVSTGVRVDTIAAELVVFAATAATRVSIWPIDASGVESAQVWAGDSFTINARRYDVTGSGAVFDTAMDWQFGPTNFNNKYGTTKKFSRVLRSAAAGTAEGVVWQDKVTLQVFVTWLEATPATYELPSTRTGLLYAACGNGKDEIVYILANSSRLNKDDKVTPLRVTFYKVGVLGSPILQVEADTSKTALNFWEAFSSGASMVWNAAKGELGLVISRTMTQTPDTLNHQGAIAVVLDASTLAIKKNWGQTSGHSFGNSITLSSAGDFVGIDLGDNYPRGINMWRFNSSTKGSKLVYQFKTQHGKTAASPAGVSYGVYPEISNLPPNNVTYYKWSNDNGVYTELAHPGLIELGGAYLVLFQGEQAALDNSKVGKALNAPRDIGFVSVSKDMKDKTVFSTGKTETSGFYTFGGTWSNQTVVGVQWLTAHATTTTTNAAGVATESYNENACRLKATRIGTGRNVLLYEIWTGSAYVETRLMEVDDSGAITRPAVAVASPVAVRLPYADDSFNPTGTQSMVLFSSAEGRIVRYEVVPNIGSPAAPVNPTAAPTASPTAAPTGAPSTTRPSLTPSIAPSLFPTLVPSARPSPSPTALPSSGAPTTQPSARPTLSPSASPSADPTLSPTGTPSSLTPTTAAPSRAPTFMPTVPAGTPSAPPTAAAPATAAPTAAPTAGPTRYPSLQPTRSPTGSPTLDPTPTPTPPPTSTDAPTTAPTGFPTLTPSLAASAVPTLAPSLAPTSGASSAATKAPSLTGPLPTAVADQLIAPNASAAALAANGGAAPGAANAGGANTGMIVGIVVGVVGIVAVLAGVVHLVMRSQQRVERRKAAEEAIVQQQQQRNLNKAYTYRALA